MRKIKNTVDLTKVHVPLKDFVFDFELVNDPLYKITFP